MHVAAVLSAAASELRSGDAGGSWWFERLAPAAAELGVWVHATTEVQLAVRDRVEAERDRTCYAASIDPPPAGGHALGAVARLATASSDFALELLSDGELPTQRHVDLAARHLSRLMALTPAAERAAVLFQCWRHWSRDLTPERRLELAVEADVTALSAEVAEPSPEAAPAWNRYLGEVTAILREQARASAAIPANYLLFDLARRTHDRLGIGTGEQATAARLLRALVVREASLPTGRPAAGPAASGASAFVVPALRRP